MNFWALFICRAVFCDYRSPIAAGMYWRLRRLRKEGLTRPLKDIYWASRRRERKTISGALTLRAEAITRLSLRNPHPAPRWWGCLPRRVATYIGWATGVVFRHQLQDACIRRG